MQQTLNRLNLYFKNLYLDYYQTFRDAHRIAKAKPLRATVYGSSFVLILNLFRTNEDLRSYSNEVISACNRLGSVTQGSRNPKSCEFVQDIGSLNCQGLLKEVNLGFLTLIYKSEYNQELALFRANCSYLNPTISEFLRERLVDFGLLGHWFKLDSKMKDYDINEEEIFPTNIPI